VPPQRRRPNPSTGQTPPVRRPRVAGLRNRTDHPESPEGLTTEQPAIPAEPEPEERESVSGVLDGVLGQSPRRAKPGEQADSSADAADDAADDDADADLEALRAAAAANEPPAADDDTDDDVDDAEDTDEDADTDDVEDTEVVEKKPARKPRAVPAGSRPAGKRRATGKARPDDLSAAETDTDTARRPRHARADDQPALSARTKGQRQISVAIVLAVVAVVLGGLAVFFRGQADDLESVDSNTALTDSAATSQIKGQLTTAIKQTFSYNYTDLDATEKAVKDNLVGKALCEYNLLFGQVKEFAPKQKIVLDTTVRELALVRVDGDRAEALVYIDQLSTRVDVNKTVAVGGQFAVQAAKQGDHWKITEFDMFGQPLFNGQPAPKC
jgi:Mce-associated membrane protein